MTHSIERGTSRGSPYLHIELETDEVTIEGLDVHGYYYMGSGDDEELSLLSDDDEVLIDTNEKSLGTNLGYGRLEIALPEAFYDDLIDALEAHLPEEY
jgi:hypothetical protein